MQADGVEHPGRSFAKARSGRTLDRFEGKALGNEAADFVQIDEMGKLYAVTEGAAGGKNGIAKTQSADIYAEIDSADRSHSAGRIA